MEYELPTEIWCIISEYLVHRACDYCALMQASWLLYNALNTQKYAHKCRFAPNILQIRSAKRRKCELLYNYRIVFDKLTYKRITTWQKAKMTQLDSNYYVLFITSGNCRTKIREFSDCVVIRCGKN